MVQVSFKFEGFLQKSCTILWKLCIVLLKNKCFVSIEREEWTEILCWLARDWYLPVHKYKYKSQSRFNWARAPNDFFGQGSKLDFDCSFIRCNDPFGVHPLAELCNLVSCCDCFGHKLVHCVFFNFIQN
jgi:hypothetical protein